APSTGPATARQLACTLLAPRARVEVSGGGRAGPRRRPAAPGGRPHTTPVCDLPPGLPAPGPGRSGRSGIGPDLASRLDLAATPPETSIRALEAGVEAERRATRAGVD